MQEDNPAHGAYPWLGSPTGLHTEEYSLLQRGPHHGDNRGEECGWEKHCDKEEKENVTKCEMCNLNNKINLIRIVFW